MFMHALILHGIGSRSGAHWQSWLCHQLEKIEWQVSMPQLPNAARPSRHEWLEEVRAVASTVDPSSLIIVGHSLGVTTALDYIQGATHPIRGLLCVAGFSYDYGSDLNGEFLREMSIDLPSVREKVQHIEVLFGDDDPYVDATALHDLAAGLNVEPRVLAEGGHLNTESGFVEFPELLDAARRCI